MTEKKGNDNAMELAYLTDIQDRIFTMRGAQVMLDRDLAALYNVETGALNQAVKRNVNYQPLKGLAFNARAGSLPRQPCT